MKKKGGANAGNAGVNNLFPAGNANVNAPNIFAPAPAAAIGGGGGGVCPQFGNYSLTYLFTYAYTYLLNYYSEYLSKY